MVSTTQPTQFGNAVFVHDLDVKELDAAMMAIGYKHVDESIFGGSRATFLTAERYYLHSVFGLATLKNQLLETVGLSAQFHLQGIVLAQQLDILWHD